jgi:hypothetical protein
MQSLQFLHLRLLEVSSVLPPAINFLQFDFNFIHDFRVLLNFGVDVEY